MLILGNLKHARQRRHLQPAQMAEMTGISRKRYGQLELHTRNISEPWFKEAIVLARVLNVEGIRDLLDKGKVKPLTQYQIGKPMPTDRDIFRSGLQMDLATACRVAVEFGLDDPLHLVQPPTELVNQVWSVVASGERIGGSCPWCLEPVVGDAGHLPTCLPANLFGVRSRRLAPNVSFSPAPKIAGGAHGASGLAHGLKRIRASHGLTQAAMGALFGVKPDHYAKMERCAVNLTVCRAECLANKLGIDVNAIYAA